MSSPRGDSNSVQQEYARVALAEVPARSHFLPEAMGGTFGVGRVCRPLKWGTPCFSLLILSQRLLFSDGVPL
jgi:hypothetical protein